MTLILQTNEGLETANSYADVALADAHLALHTSFATWDALDDPVKEDWLILASAYADRAWAWKGEPVLEAAGTLRFPRKCLYDLDDRLITGIPDDFRRGICEIAMSFALETPFEDDELENIVEAKVDVLLVKFSQTKRTSPVPKTVMYRMGVYGSFRQGSRRLGRLA